MHSQYLGSSLIILATHQPPHIPRASVYPAVRILRLSTPLAIEDAGAVRFVNVLECAERVARVWRKSGGDGVEELSETELDNAAGPGSLSPPNAFRFASTGSIPSSPQSSTERLNTERPSSPSRRRLRAASSLTFSKAKGQSLPPVDTSQRPFDCILNFLPSNVSDKAILKQSILVTTISRPFLTAASNPTRPTTARNPSRVSVGGGATEDGRRWSSILQRKSLYSAPTTPYANRSRSSFYSSPGGSSVIAPSVPTVPRRAHLVHVIPPASISVSRRKLMQSMESFLCSFAYPTPLEIGQQDVAGMERAAPFLMYPSTLSSVVRHARPSLMPESASSENIASEWIIADLLLSGALDRPTGATEMERSSPRAWIANANDITFVPSSRPGSMRSVNVAQPIPSPAIRERQRDGSFLWSANGTASDGGHNLARYESSSGTGESSVHGTVSETGMLTPELTPPSTPDTIVNAPVPGSPAPMEKVFRLSQFHPMGGDKALPTPPDSEESESSGSMRNITPPTRVRTISMFMGPKKSKMEDGIVKPSKGWNSKWKFWKVSITTASA